ncbi:MAG: flagellar basal body P-ring protein FlgI [Planctomycetota bacterium]
MQRTANPITLAVLLAASWWIPATAQAQIRIKDICRVKGQEENVLQGLGIVVGLKGTGDGASFLPTIRSLAKVMTVMGEATGQAGLAELKDSKNVALVIVTARVPAEGSRQGGRLDCSVSSVGSAKSLAGGRLFLTALIGPDRNNPRVFALAEGSVTLEDANMPTTGTVIRGCKLEEDFFNAYSQDGKLTLVIDQNHADFQLAQDIAELINADLSFQSSGILLARALDATNVEVTIPAQYRNDPVAFVSQVLSRPVLEPQAAAMVVINERTGSIVISGDVEIGAVAVSHKNVAVETGGGVVMRNFTPVDPGSRSEAKLKTLVEALNAVHVPTEDIIDIIRLIDRNKKLYAKLVFE